MQRGRYYKDLENITSEEWLYRTFEMNLKNVIYVRAVTEIWGKSFKIIADSFL